MFIPGTRKRRRFVLILLIVCCCVEPLSSASSYVGYRIAENEVTSLYFSDALHGWISIARKERGYVFATRDGGRSWQPAKFQQPVHRAFFINSNVGWVICRNGSEIDPGAYHLWKTLDGGTNWTFVSTIVSSTSGRKVFLHGFIFIDELRGWFTLGNEANRGYLVQTNDGGLSFQEVSALEKIGKIDGISTNGKNAIWMFREESILWSNDVGKNWHEEALVPWDKRLHRAVFLPDGRGWAVGGSGTGMILSTRSLGEKWTLAQESETASILFATSLSKGGTGYAVGVSRLLFQTRDFGESWNAKPVLPQEKDDQADFFIQVMVLPSGRGWVVRGGGFLYQTEDSGNTWRELDLVKETRMKR